LRIPITAHPSLYALKDGSDGPNADRLGTTKVRRNKYIKKGYIDEKLVAGIYAMLDVGVSFSIKYHPQSKPLERFFKTLDLQFSKTVPTYCGENADRKPTDLKRLLQSDREIARAYNLEDFATLLGEYVETVYNRAPHSGAGMEGKSPLAVLATRSSRRVLKDGVADLLLRVWSGQLVIGKNGVKFNGMWYGQWDSELLMRQGRKVRVAYDPDDLRTVHVYDAISMKLITTAEQNEMIGYGAVGEEATREAIAKQRRAVKALKQQKTHQRIAQTDLPTLAIQAQRAAIEQNEPGRPAERAASLQPVRTVMDEQVAEHERVRKQRLLRKAAGAEQVKRFIDIDLTPPPETSAVNWFDE